MWLFDIHGFMEVASIMQGKKDLTNKEEKEIDFNEGQKGLTSKIDFPLPVEWTNNQDFNEGGEKKKPNLNIPRIEWERVLEYLRSG